MVRKAMTPLMPPPLPLLLLPLPLLPPPLLPPLAAGCWAAGPACPAACGHPPPVLLEPLPGRVACCGRCSSSQRSGRKAAASAPHQAGSRCIRCGHTSTVVPAGAIGMRGGTAGWVGVAGRQPDALPLACVGHAPGQQPFAATNRRWGQPGLTLRQEVAGQVGVLRSAAAHQVGGRGQPAVQGGGWPSEPSEGAERSRQCCQVGMQASRHGLAEDARKGGRTTTHSRQSPSCGAHPPTHRIASNTAASTSGRRPASATSSALPSPPPPPPPSRAATSAAAASWAAGWWAR